MTINLSTVHSILYCSHFCLCWDLASETLFIKVTVGLVPRPISLVMCTESTLGMRLGHHGTQSPWDPVTIRQMVALPFCTVIVQLEQGVAAIIEVAAYSIDHHSQIAL